MSTFFFNVLWLTCFLKCLSHDCFEVLSVPFSFINCHAEWQVFGMGGVLKNLVKGNGMYLINMVY